MPVVFSDHVPVPGPTARALLLACALAGLATGCAPYRLEGRVIAGPAPVVVVVDADDPRLEQAGLAGAVIEATLDPTSLSPQRLGATVAGPAGHFRLPVEATGAGWLEYDLGLLVRSEGFATLWQTLDLPPADRRLLVVLKPGPAGKAGPPPDIVEETLEMAR